MSLMRVGVGGPCDFSFPDFNILLAENKFDIYSCSGDYQSVLEKYN